MSNHPNIDELRDLNNKLQRLLEKPEPGLFGWRMAVNQVLLEMSAFVVHTVEDPRVEKLQGK